MQYEILDHHPTDDGRHLLRVAQWYDNDAARPPDFVQDFIIHQPLPRKVNITNDLGHRKTVSGRWLPTQQLINDEWVPLPEKGHADDPWEVVEIPAGDPLVIFDEVVKATLESNALAQRPGTDLVTDEVTAVKPKANAPTSDATTRFRQRKNKREFHIPLKAAPANDTGQIPRAPGRRPR